MKTSLLSLLAATLLTLSLSIARADNAAPATPAAPSGGGSTDLAAGGPGGGRGEKLKEALAQLDLSDAQKEQIKQIRATVTDRKERRQQIMAVLTPDQQAKLKQMIQQFISERQAAGAAQ